MKIALTVVGLLLVITGIIWILQGLNFLPGSFMTGQIRWAYNGAVSLAFGVALLVIARLRKAL